jgi:hypothetical protein
MIDCGLREYLGGGEWGKREQKKMIKGTPQTQKFSCFGFYRSLADADGGKWEVDETRQTFFIILPLWRDDCLVTGLYSCARQLFVCWTGAGNQGHQTIGPFPSSFSGMAAFALFKRYNNSTRWLDAVHLGSMSNVPNTRRQLVWRFIGSTWLHPHMYPILYNTNSPAASLSSTLRQLAPSKADMSIVWAWMDSDNQYYTERIMLAAQKISSVNSSVM